MTSSRGAEVEAGGRADPHRRPRQLPLPAPERTPAVDAPRRMQVTWVMPHIPHTPPSSPTSDPSSFGGCSMSSSRRGDGDQQATRATVFVVDSGEYIVTTAGRGRSRSSVDGGRHQPVRPRSPRPPPPPPLPPPHPPRPPRAPTGARRARARVFGAARRCAAKDCVVAMAAASRHPERRRALTGVTLARSTSRRSRRSACTSSPR